MVDIKKLQRKRRVHQVRRTRKVRGRTIRVRVSDPRYQIGTSNTEKDRQYAALHPGKRISKKGNAYYERRRNRSDRNKRLKL